MMKRHSFSVHFLILSFIFVLCGLSSCDNDVKSVAVVKKDVVVPNFDAHRAFADIEKQCSFGPRVPESEAHESCSEWLIETLKAEADTVFVQDFRTRIYDGQLLDGRNIIASFNGDAKKRIVVAAHWDSRPFADNDPDESNWRKAIDGANDGASGVGIILEIARIVNKNPLNEKTGLDLVLFDLEDYGPPASSNEHSDNAWGLGSQYWSAHPHKPGYRAYMGMLLDMVGNANPRFPKEYYSNQLAAHICDKVWKTAQRLGYDGVFLDEVGHPINDDHISMNIVAGIPTVDIIHLEENDSESSFHSTWHTLDDNISNISESTLQIVGNVVLNVIYSE